MKSVVSSIRPWHAVGLAMVAAVLAAPLATGQAGEAAAGADRHEVVVYKSPYCGCCTKWVEHLRAHGFAVEEVATDDVAAVKARHGVPSRLASCHTAVVGGYAVEGHVPASVVQRLLAEKPDLAGVAVPGMPVGSPGMEGPNPVKYAVHGFDEAGTISVYSVEEGREHAH